MIQERIAFFLVLVAAGYFLKNLGFHRAVISGVSSLLLKAGKVKWAFRVKELGDKKGKCCS